MPFKMDMESLVILLTFVLRIWSLYAVWFDEMFLNDLDFIGV